jgi:hypothetical protein
MFFFFQGKKKNPDKESGTNLEKTKGSASNFQESNSKEG